MNRYKNIPIMLALEVGSAFLLVFLVLAILDAHWDKTEEKTILLGQYYTIEPTSLMDSLKHGEMAFTPVSQEPELLPVDQQIVVNWLQADYFYIANTLYESVLGKSLQGWQLNSMDFQLSCSKIQNGFQNGRPTFFNEIQANNR